MESKKKRNHSGANMEQTRKKLYREIVKLSTKQLLLSLFDVAAMFGAFDVRPRYIRAYHEYFDMRARDYQKFYKLLYKLKTAHLVEVYGEGKEKFVELTKEGRKRITKYLFQGGKVPVPRLWDGKWRLVIFDIPEDQKATRNVVRQLLYRVGFYQLQKSVYVYPHNCIGMVRYLEETYDLDRYIQFAIVERLETELDLISLFHERGIIRSIKRRKVSRANQDETR